MVESAPVTKTLRVWLGGAIVGVGILFVFVVFQAARMTELNDLRAMDLAQVARNLAAGEGFTTDFIRPQTLALAPRVTGHPDLVHGPVQPFFMSLLFRAFGATNQAISWSSGIPFLLSVPLVFWVGLKSFSRKVGVLAAVLLATNVAALGMGVSGTEAGMLTFLFTLLCLVLIAHQGKKSPRVLLVALAGILSGLLYLTHFVWIVAIAPVLLVILITSLPQHRIPSVLVYFVALAVVLAPWFYRVYRVAGSPLANPSAYEMLVSTRTYTGNIIYRSFEQTPPGVVSFLIASPREVYERARDAAVAMYPEWFGVAGLVVVPFFLVAAIVPLGHAGLDRLRPGLYVLAGLLFVALCLTTPEPRLFIPMAPIITLIAVAFFYQLLDLRLRPLTERLRGRWVVTAVTVLMLLHLIPLFLQLAPGRPIAPTLPMAVRRASQELNALIPQLRGRETAPAAVLSDMPWAVAWYAQRPAIWLPRNDVDLRRIEQTCGQIRWLVLTPQIVDVAQQEQAVGWARLWQRAIMGAPVTGGWRVRQIFANGNWVLFERVPDVASTGTLPAAP